jgi:hypothetical protein
MRVHDVGPLLPDQRGDPRGQAAHLQGLADQWQPAPAAAGTAGPMESPAIHAFLRREAGIVPRAGELDGFPPETALGGEDAERTEHVAALQRQGMIEDVQDAHAGSRADATRRRACR